MLLDRRQTSAHEEKNKIIQNVSQIEIYEARWLFLSQFWPLLNQALFLEAAVVVV